MNLFTRKRAQKLVPKNVEDTASVFSFGSHRKVTYFDFQRSEQINLGWKGQWEEWGKRNHPGFSKIYILADFNLVPSFQLINSFNDHFRWPP